MGLYDIPAMTDYILKYTGVEKLAAYIGHSMGTTQFFVGSSLIPDYYTKHINLYVALAPVARMDHTLVEAFTYLSEISGFLTSLVQYFHIWNIVPYNHNVGEYMADICRYLPHLCVVINEGFWDWDDEIDNAERYPDSVAYQPCGSGWRNLVHYAQIIKSKRF